MVRDRDWQERFDQAELLTVKEEDLSIALENWQVENISNQSLTRSSLRVIDDGNLGGNTGFGQSDKAWQELLEGAEQSVQYGDEAVFSFSQHSLSSFHERNENNFNSVSEDQLIDFIGEVLEFFRRSAPEVTLNLSLGKSYSEIELRTSRSARLRENRSNFGLMVSIPIPGGGSRFYRVFEQDEMFTKLPEAELTEFLREYEKAGEVSSPDTGRMPVIFTPRALYFFTVSLTEGIGADNIYRQTSPLQEKLGERIFSPAINITDRPHMEDAGSRRYFDDEGIPTRQQVIVDEGVLENYIYDLEHAARMEEKPRGNGLKRSLFSSGMGVPVSPSLVNPVIDPGETDKEDMISGLNEGIMVENIVGFHSSNYSQGHFSVQAHGYHIQEGELKGRLEDVMIAGNIYEDFMEVEAVGDKLYPGSYGYYPYMLVPDIQVSAR